MRLTQATVVASLALTVAAKPLQARDDISSNNDYKTNPDPYLAKCHDGSGREKPGDDHCTAGPIDRRD